MYSGAPKPSLAPHFVIGAAFLVGGCVLAWLGSSATLVCTRADGVGCTMTVKSFGLATLSAERIEDVKSLEMRRSRVEGSRSRTPDRLIFHTGNGEVDLGLFFQRFRRYQGELDAFLKDADQKEISLSSAAPGRERRRFLAAQTVTVLLVFTGLAMLVSAVGKAVRKDD